MRLALAFGRTATELEETMGEREWLEWEAFQMAGEPIGEERQDWRMATLTAMFANANFKQDEGAFRAREFLYLPELREREVVEDASLEVAEMARSWGAKV
jgi:hypothetical protein